VRLDHLDYVLGRGYVEIFAVADRH
jgi:hypothetical protein